MKKVILPSYTHIIENNKNLPSSKINAINGIDLKELSTVIFSAKQWINFEFEVKKKFNTLIYWV